MSEKKFCDMDDEERLVDLRDQVRRFNSWQLPGQTMGTHMGTSYLVGDLMRELERARE